MRKSSMGYVQIRIRKAVDRHVLIVLAIFGLLLLLLLTSPYLVPAGQLRDLSGNVLSVDNQNQFSGINPVAWMVYSFGDLNCHQLRDRSFFLNDNQMPMCSRDTGIFVGLFAGALALFVFSLSTRKRYMVIGLLPMIVDGLFQASTDYESDNSVRFVTGIIAGAAFAMFACMLVAMPEGEGEGVAPISSEYRKTQ